MLNALLWCGIIAFDILPAALGDDAPLRGVVALAEDLQDGLSLIDS